MNLQRQSYFSVSSVGVPIRNTADYSPFGVQLDGRTVQGDFYRFGYQGSEKDDESKGGGNSYTTFFRQLDPRVGRWFSVDPVFQPWQSPYCSMDNNPILFNDVFGDVIGVGKKKKEINKDDHIRKTKIEPIPSSDIEIVNGAIKEGQLKYRTVFCDNGKEVTKSDQRKLNRKEERIDNKIDKITAHNKKIDDKKALFKNDLFDFKYNDKTGVLENPSLKPNVNNIDDNSVLGILFQTMESDKTYNLKTNKVPWQQMTSQGLLLSIAPNSFAFLGKNTGAVSQLMIDTGNEPKLQTMIASDAAEFLGIRKHASAAFKLFTGLEASEYHSLRTDFNRVGIEFMFSSKFKHVIKHDPLPFYFNEE